MGASQAQTVCIPNPLYVSIGLPGVYPSPLPPLNQDTLNPGTLGTAYSQTFTLVVPADTMIDLAAISGIPGLPVANVSINYQEVTAISGLPNGLNYACNIGTCQWPGGTAGCIKLSGIPTQSGLFNVSMTAGYNATVPQGIPLIGGTAITIPFPGLNWTMNMVAVGVDDHQADALTIGHNSPNPFHGSTTIQYQAPKPGMIAFEVTDLTGTHLYSTQMRANIGDNQFVFDASNLAPGIYFYKLSNGAMSAMSKMVIR